ncbi:MAG: aminoacyl-tRNA hydrolase [Acidobacteriota bacterium]
MEEPRPARIRAVCGLGNPGPEYELTRHNIGFMVARRLAAEIGARLTRKECQSHSTHLVRVWGGDVLVFTPMTFMNLSGEAVRAMSRKYGFDPAELIVVHDDADLPFGQLRIRARGGSAGHRGIVSIIDALGADRFARLRLGVANPNRDRNLRDFVLDEFDTGEVSELERFQSAALEALRVVITEGLTTAMNRFNRKAPKRLTTEPPPAATE